jgi:hypothetical protein
MHLRPAAIPAQTGKQPVPQYRNLATAAHCVPGDQRKGEKD